MKGVIALLLFFCIVSFCDAQDKNAYGSSTICFSVSDLKEAVNWYSELLGDLDNFSPAPGIIEFQLNESTWLQLFEGSDTGGAILRLEVEDIQLEHKRLEGLGMSLTSVEYVPGMVSYFDFEDRDGNQLSFYKLETQ